MKRFLFAVFTVLLISSIYSENIYAKSDNDRIYTIPVDRFLNQDKSNDVGVPGEEDPMLPYGGDFKGIETQLDYIKEMGFNTVELSPVFEMEEDDYLGYDVVDYDKIAPRYGGSDEFKQLIEKAHDKEMKIIVDLPVTQTDNYTGVNPSNLPKQMSDYYSHIDREFIDLKNRKNQEQYFNFVTKFIEQFDVDGISMYIVQDGLNREDFLPNGVTAYGINVSGGDTRGFDFITNEDIRTEVSNSFSSVDKEILEYPEDNTILLADHWFSERFTSEATSNNMFPGTRVKQLYLYLFGYQGPIMFNYGTEIAQNGVEFGEIHPQMDLWTDKEVVDFMKDTFIVFSQHKNMLLGKTTTLKNEGGHYIVKYDTNDIDFVYNINNTSKTEKTVLNKDIISTDKEMSGLLIGDVARPHGKEFNIVIDREETELYAIVEPAGFNHWYLISSFIVFGGFAVFIFIVARRSKRKRITE